MVSRISQSMLRNQFVWLVFFRSFSQDELLIEHLRADIAKLNANIITTCLSQGIPIEFTNVTHTPENLLKLLTFDQYPTRFV
jgi:hypothetical protein